MHEYSLAQAVINSIAELCQKNRAKGLEATVVLGELQQIEEGIFREALRELKKEQGLRARLRIKKENACFRCRACGFEWEFSKKKSNLSASSTECIHFLPDIAQCYMRCPRCKSHDFEIVRGRGVRIDEIKIIDARSRSSKSKKKKSKNAK